MSAASTVGFAVGHPNYLDVKPFKLDPEAVHRLPAEARGEFLRRVALNARHLLIDVLVDDPDSWQFVRIDTPDGALTVPELKRLVRQMVAPGCRGFIFHDVERCNYVAVAEGGNLMEEDTPTWREARHRHAPFNLRYHVGETDSDESD